MVNQHLERWASAIYDELKLRLGASGTAYDIVKAYDSNDIYISVALSAGGNNSVESIIRLYPATAPACGAYDSLGLAQTVFSPHVAKVLFDITSIADGTSELVRTYVMAIVAKLGSRLEVYTKSAGAANIVLADFVVGNLAAVMDDMPFGVIGNV